MISGLFYPLKVSGSGDLVAASTLDETMIRSWAQYLIDTEQPFQVFQSSNASEISLGVEKFQYALASKCPLVGLQVSASKEGGSLIVTVKWQENATSVVVQQTS